MIRTGPRSIARVVLAHQLKFAPFDPSCRVISRSDIEIVAAGKFDACDLTGGEFAQYLSLPCGGQAQRGLRWKDDTH